MVIMNQYGPLRPSLPIHLGVAYYSRLAVLLPSTYETAPEILREVEDALESRLSQQVQMQRRRAAGLSAVASILQAATAYGHADSRQPGHPQPCPGRALGPQPLAFDDLADADEPRAGRGGAVGRPGPAADGLGRRGAGRWWSACSAQLSPAEAQQAREQLDHPGPLRLSDVEEARRQIARLAQREMLRRQRIATSLTS